MYFDPKILDGDITDDQFMPVDKEAVRLAVKEYFPVLEFCHSIKSGLVTLSLSDYRTLTPATIQVWQLFDAEYERIRQSKANKKRKPQT